MQCLVRICSDRAAALSRAQPDNPEKAARIPSVFLRQVRASIRFGVSVVMAAARRCSYLEYAEETPCLSAAFYLLELISRQGPRCQVMVCRDHVHKAWEFGQRTLERRFPKRQLKLAAVRLMPILEQKAEKKKAFGKGAGQL